MKNKAEKLFRNYFKNNKLFKGELTTKKGMPDFMILNKKKEIIGFVEVKRTDAKDGLRKEQIYFREFCKADKRFKERWMNG